MPRPKRCGSTTAGTWRHGTRLNLERSLRLGDELGGHMVSGHVDGIAELVARDDFLDSAGLSLRVPSALSRFIAAKGSVALDGVVAHRQRGRGRHILGADHPAHLAGHHARIAPAGSAASTSKSTSWRAMPRACWRRCRAEAALVSGPCAWYDHAHELIRVEAAGVKPMAGPRRGKRADGASAKARASSSSRRASTTTLPTRCWPARRKRSKKRAPRSTASACRARLKSRPRLRSRSMRRSAAAAL